MQFPFFTFSAFSTLFTFFTFFTFFALVSSTSSVFKTKFIVNGNVPKCANCIYLDKNNLIVEGDPFYLSRCTKFGVAHLVSGDITYEYADFCRKDDAKCGVQGKYFSPIGESKQPEEEYKESKQPH